MNSRYRWQREDSFRDYQTATLTHDIKYSMSPAETDESPSWLVNIRNQNRTGESSRQAAPKGEAAVRTMMTRDDSFTRQPPQSPNPVPQRGVPSYPSKRSINSDDCVSSLGMYSRSGNPPYTASPKSYSSGRDSSGDYSKTSPYSIESPTLSNQKPQGPMAVSCPSLYPSDSFRNNASVLQHYDYEDPRSGPFNASRNEKVLSLEPRPTVSSRSDYRQPGAVSISRPSLTSMDSFRTNSSGPRHQVSDKMYQATPKSTLCQEKIGPAGPGDNTVEIMPGVYARLRGAQETWRCVEQDFYVPCQCMCCTLDLCCIMDAEYVLCPACRVISPLEGDAGSSGDEGGVGLGFTFDDLMRWQEQIVQARQARQEPASGRGGYPDHYHGRNAKY